MRSALPRIPAFFLAAGMIFAAALPTIGEETAAAPAPATWAVLIGCEQYLRVPPLRYTNNDVKELAETLRRGGIADDFILEMTDQTGNDRFKPLRSSIVAELQPWLQRIAEDDSVLIYFSGHGFRDASGKLYLAPLDFDRKRPAETGIAVEWLREQLADCKAKFKLLVLDACHAGSEKGDDDKLEVETPNPGDAKHGGAKPGATELGGEKLGESFRDMKHVVTIASSTGEERSQLWDEHKQSLFSFWLNQGLKGHADRNGDGVIDVDELYDYVYKEVTRTAKARFPLTQTPVRIIRGGEGVPEVIRPHPQLLRGLLRDVAERLAEDLGQQRIASVGVLPFTSQSPEGEEFIGKDFGAMGHWCASDVESHLVELGQGRFSVRDQHRLLAATNKLKLSIAQLGDCGVMQQLTKDVDGLPVLVEGSFQGRRGAVVTLRCKLVRTDTGDVIGTAGGTASLNESEWAMLGFSAVVRDEDRRQDPPPRGRRPLPPNEQDVPRLDMHVAKDSRQLMDPNNPLRIWIAVNGEERKGSFKDNEYYVPLKVGEEYEVYVQNDTGSEVLTRLIVDGLNTRSQPADYKGIGTNEVAPRVNLNDAWHWSLLPKTGQDRNGHKVWCINGFEEKTGAQGELGRFCVAPAEESLAAHKQFTKQIGLITAAFYRPGTAPINETVNYVKSRRVPMGTKISRTEQVAIDEIGSQYVGEMVAAITIHYVDPSDMPRKDQ